MVFILKKIELKRTENKEKGSSNSISRAHHCMHYWKESQIPTPISIILPKKFIKKLKNNNNTFKECTYIYHNPSFIKKKKNSNTTFNIILLFHKMHKYLLQFSINIIIYIRCCPKVKYIKYYCID